MRASVRVWVCVCFSSMKQDVFGPAPVCVKFYGCVAVCFLKASVPYLSVVLSERSVRPPSAFFFFFCCCCSNPNEKVAVVVLVFRSNLYYSQRVACINAEYRNSGFCWGFFCFFVFFGGGVFVLAVVVFFNPLRITVSSEFVVSVFCLVSLRIPPPSSPRPANLPHATF